MVGNGGETNVDANECRHVFDVLVLVEKEFALWF